MPKKQSEIIDGDNWVEFLTDEKLSIVKRERQFQRAEKIFSAIWIILLTAGVVLIFFLPWVGSYLVFASLLFAGLAMDCSGYLWGVAEGRLEHNLDHLIKYEKERRENGKHFKSGK